MSTSTIFEKNFLSVFFKYRMGMECSLIGHFCVDSAGGLVKAMDYEIQI